MTANPFAGAEFALSVATLEGLPPESSPEVVFAGRSNVGKSSAINALAARNRLAFVSKTPGRTQTINFFTLGAAKQVSAFLVDLPGYGYAKVPHAIRDQWGALVGGYLAARASIAGIVLLMDIRHPFMPHDEKMLDWIAPLERPVLVLLSKADKLSPAERRRVAAAVSRRLEDAGALGSALPFSALRGEGVDQTRQVVSTWLGSPKPGRAIKSPR